MPKRAASEPKRQRTAPEIFGRNLRNARIKAGLTQVEVSQMTGIQQPRLSALEAGKHDVLISTALKLAQAVGCPLSGLFIE
jgi:transcriptional regulator with XRE-family HTH domain